MRDSVLDICNTKMADKLVNNHGCLTLSLLIALTIAAIFVTDLGLINAVGGGLVTTPIVFVFPTIMYQCAMKLVSPDESSSQKNQVALTNCLTLLGAIFGLAGAWIAISDVLEG